ncbi:metal transporter nramp1 homolog isoform X1, partial [Argonauta hians]
ILVKKLLLREHVFVNKTQVWYVSCDETNDSDKKPTDDSGDFDKKYERLNKAIPEEVTAPPEDESEQPRRFSFRKLLTFTGPGFLMSIAYLDPGNIESDLQTGIIVKYKLLWMLFWSTFMGLILQLLSARLGSVTGKNLAQVCRKEYPKFPRLLLWIMIELAIIGSDIQEVVGSAIAINLLSNEMVPIWAGVLITGIDTFTFLFLESAGLRKLEAFFCMLIVTMAASFLYMFIVIKPSFVEIVKGLVIPWCADCDKDGIQQMVGIIGAVVMPHNIYLHSALVLSRYIDRKDKRNIKEANLYYSIESSVSLFVSFIINLFVVTVFAAGNLPRDQNTLFTAGTWLSTHFQIPALKIIWGIGVLASGQSSTMTGTYTGQFVMEGFLNIKWAKWKRVLMTRSIAMVPTILVALLATKYLDIMNNWLNVLQSVELPFALFPILHFTNSFKIMKDFKNGKIMQFGVWFLAILDIGVNVYLVRLFIANDNPWYVYLITVIIGLLYFMFVLYLGIGIKNFLRLKIFILKCLGRPTDHCEAAIEEHDRISYDILEEEN